MALTDTQIRKNLILALRKVEQEIIDFELPLSLSGYEYFATAGTFGKKSGSERHWVASIAIADDKASVDAVLQFVSGKS